jgi:hypothetical protein
MEKTPMQQLIDKIELYDQRGGINMPTLKAVLQSYLRLETEYLEKLKENQTSNISEDASLLIDKIDKAIQKFGTYSYDDKGPHEVMNMNDIIKFLKNKPLKEIGKILSEVLDNYSNYSRASYFVNTVIGEFDYLPEEEFEQLLDCDKRFEY